MCLKVYNQIIKAKTINMKNILLLLSLILISSCINQKAIDAKHKHQAETGSRINNAQHDTDSLFNEME